MPRRARISPDGFVQHVINRGDHRETIFHTRADFAAFLAFMAAAARRVPMRILAYCIMRNHFHLLLWPYKGIDLSAYMQLLMNLHIQRYLRQHRPSSPGHIYQGRYRNVIVQSGPEVLRVARYVEANPLVAGLVKRADDYKWSSLWRFAERPGRPKLEPDVIERSRAWLQFVHESIGEESTAEIGRRIKKGLPIGDDEWTARVVAAHGLQHATRGPGRPRVYEVLPP
ncbi:MAG TPA: transposase [Vicinamibacterales bacterium]|jgi:putative transposase|nr:transposase [Vicinamibacterales bacterium]